MGPGTLEARLSRRLVGISGAVLVVVGVASAVMTDRVLDAVDTERAAGRAELAREALERELDEGDSPAQAAREVEGESSNESERVIIRRVQDLAWITRPDVPGLASTGCTTFADARGQPWRACISHSPRADVAAAVPIAAHRAAVATVQRGMAGIVVLALVGLWIAVSRTVRSALRELLGLMGWTAEILREERPITPPPAQTLEIQRLGAAFDALVRRLLQSLARERAQSAHIAHELRTPLTAIVAELDALEGGDPRVRSAIARARSDAARLADVIDAILILSTRPTHNGHPRSVVNLADLARELAPAGVRVRAPDEALVEGDERLLGLALRNLLENAGKYAGGAEAIEVTRDRDGIRLAVVDQGPGLAPEARVRMFERYWRGVADGEGRGLGLALVRAVAELHAGEARAAPGPGGRGLDVSIRVGRVVGWHDDPPAASR